MENQQFQEAAEVATFGRRKVIPRVCIADAKQHVRVWLGETLEELGFAVCECAKAHELNPVLDVTLPDLVVIGFSGGGVEAAGMVRMLATKFYRGKVLLIGPYNSPMVKAVQELGEGLGLAMLPLLATPYRNEHLRQTVADLLPAELPPSLPVDASEALQAGWLELWYQPKIDARTVTLRGAEALIRMRHPNWGIVPPAYFMPDDGDPHFCALSEFVIDRAIADWHYFVLGT